MSKKQDASYKRTKAGILIAALAMFAAMAVLLSVIFVETMGTKRTGYVFSTEITASDPVGFSEFMSSNVSYYILGERAQPTDWIELRNTSDSDVSVENYSIMLASDPKSLYLLPKAVIPAGGYLLLYADGNKDQTTAEEVHLPFKLSSAGSAVVLMNPSGAVIDSVEVVRLEEDTAYALDDTGAWQVTYMATPAEPNEILLESDLTDGAQTVSASPRAADLNGEIGITEAMSSNVSYVPDANGKYYDYLEIHNAEDHAVDLTGWSLTDKPGEGSAWYFPEGTTIGADAYLLIYCGGGTASQNNTGSDLIANFRLSSEGAEVELIGSDGMTASRVTIPAMDKDQAYSLVGESWTTAYAPTPGYSNDRAGVIGADAEQLSRNSAGVRLSEIAAGTSTLDYDWIELYNPGTEAIDLSGYGLSDNPGKPLKWTFPSGCVIQPGGYLGVYCSGKNAVTDSAIHTSFKLSKAGDYIVTLSTPSGKIFDQVYVGQQFTDISMGRVNGRDGWWYFTEPTPMAANDTQAYNGKALAPVYSQRGGLYTTGETLQVSLEPTEPGLKIYYTLDNTDPTQESTLYTQPITITSNTVLRTRVYGVDYLESYMDTQTYLFDVTGNTNVYVVSLVSDPDNLTSQEKGIMIKGPGASDEYPYEGANFWQDWEREAHVEVYTDSGEQVISAECGIKLHGQYSRAENQQAFKVFARSEYGTSSFDYPLFSNRPYTSYQSFLLRSSGQDTDKTRMRDSVLQSLASDTSVMYQETEVCVLYLNGEYWGQYYLRERVSKYSICQFEGWEGQEDDIDLIKANSREMQGSNDTFAEMLEWVKKADPTSDEFYDYIDERIDIQNYIEYMSLEIFTGNGDTLNVKRYRNGNADGKWRWVLFDLDWAFYVDTDSINRWLTPGGMGTGKRTDNTLFIACMKNPRFRDEFLTYFGDRMTTVFTTENVLSKFEARYEVLQPLLPQQLERWGQSEENYTACLKSLIEYAQSRPAKLIGYFQGTEYLNLTDEETEKYFGKALEIIAQSGYQIDS